MGFPWGFQRAQCTVGVSYAVVCQVQLKRLHRLRESLVYVTRGEDRRALSAFLRSTAGDVLILMRYMAALPAAKGICLLGSLPWGQPGPLWGLFLVPHVRGSQYLCHLLPLPRGFPVPPGLSRPWKSLGACPCAWVHWASPVRLLVPGCEGGSQPPTGWSQCPGCHYCCLGFWLLQARMGSPEMWWTQCPLGHPLNKRSWELSSPFFSWQIVLESRGFRELSEDACDIEHIACYRHAIISLSRPHSYWFSFFPFLFFSDSLFLGLWPQSFLRVSMSACVPVSGFLGALAKRGSVAIVTTTTLLVQV